MYIIINIYAGQDSTEIKCTEKKKKSKLKEKTLRT